MSRTWTIPARIFVSPSGVRGCSSMVEPLPSKQITRVRFPSSAPALGKPRATRPGAFFCSHQTMRLTWVRQLLNRATQTPNPKGRGFSGPTSVCRSRVSYYEALVRQVSRSPTTRKWKAHFSPCPCVQDSCCGAWGQESAPRIGACLSWTGW